MISKMLHKFIGLLFVLLCLFQQANAQFEEGTAMPPVFGLPALGGFDLRNGNNNTTSYFNQGENYATILNIVSLKIKEGQGIYFVSNFTATATINLELTDLNGVITTPPAITLTVNYDSATGAKYTLLDYKTFKNYKTVKVTLASDINITGANGWDPRQVVELENEMRIIRYYSLSATAADLIPSITTAQPTPDVWQVNWYFPAAAHENMSQIEWAYVETEMLPFYNNNYNLLFQNNSTRVDLDTKYTVNNQYLYTFKIPLLYPGPGKLYYRTRAVQRKSNGTLITGDWSAVSESQNSVAFDGHQSNLNWQSSSTFAEGGKYKTVIQYFDGSLRGRQTVTKDNSTGNTIVGETIYDLQGRPNVQILPTPTADNTIKYFNNFNRFNGMQVNDDPAKYFDLTPEAVKCNAAISLDSNYGNGRYYSNQNDWLNGTNGATAEAKSKFIPDALGYAFTEIRFTDDATQRVSSQGGVGVNHQINSGHETKYYYGKPSQPELDALFGTEAGDASHYSKNMVHDANGQMSVSYTDMHGRTVATSLAGDPTPGINSIINNTDYPLASGPLRNDLLTPATNIIQGNTIVSVSTILAPAYTAYNFTYKLNPAILQLLSCTNQPICFDCKYDLEISIKGENCGNDVPVIKRYNNLQMVAANQACGTPMGFIGQGITVPTTQINFDTSLAAGSYIIRKTLTINDSLFQIRKDSALKVLLCKTKDSIYQRIYDSLSIVSGCGATPLQGCDSCLANLGTFQIYKIKYLQSITPAIATDEEIHIQYATDSTECAINCGAGINPHFETLTGLREQMLADMVPFTGQYAFDSVLNKNRNIDLTRLEAKYNIFTESYIINGVTILKTKPYYKDPQHENAQPYYYTDENLVDSTIHGYNGGNFKIIDTITKLSYTRIFQNSWAASLIKYHPEYTKLQYAETVLKSSYTWLDNVQNTTSYQTANNNGYTVPVKISAGTINDPYFLVPNTAADKDTLDYKLYNGISYTANSPSIWQIANSSVLCKTVDSINKFRCIMLTKKDGIDPLITDSLDKNEAWDKFKTMYFSYRNEMVLRYINNQPNTLSQASMNTLINENKQLVFAGAQDIANQNGWGWWAGITNPAGIDTAGINGYLNSNALNNCDGMRPFWKARLQQCEVLKNKLNLETPGDSTFVNNVISTILDSLVIICHNSVTPQQPYGASTVNPAYVGNPRRFEDVINNVFNANGILTIPGDNYYCNPFTVTYPKPFGVNPPVSVNYTNKLDSCACGRFKTLKTEAAAAGYNPLNFSSMNLFLQTNYNDSLTLILWTGFQKCDSSFIDTCCTAPAITSISIIPQAGYSFIKVFYTLPSHCDSCKIYMYDPAGNQAGFYNNICGTSSAQFQITDTCIKYKFLIKCQGNTCGLLKSDTATYKGCLPINNCNTPVITSTYIIFGKFSYSIAVNYQLPAACASCTLSMYDLSNNLIQTNYNICGTTTSVFPVSDTCVAYKFIIECQNNTCGLLVSAPFYYNGCSLSSPNLQLSAGGITAPCGSCILNVTSRAQYGQPVQYIAKCEINFLPNFESVVSDNFETFIDPALLSCDTNCTKPVITNIVPYGSSKSFNVFYQIPPGKDSCRIFMYNAANSLMGYNDNICTETNTWFAGVYDSLACYKFLIKTYSPGCGWVLSDTAYYNGCISKNTCLVFKPVILSDFVALPPFLNCGYIKPCITCDKLVNVLTPEFRLLYPAYSGVPFIDSTTTDAQAKQNALWARFINFRVGFSKNALDYMLAYKNCTSGNPPVNALCAFDKPLNDPGDIFPPNYTPCEGVVTQAQFMADLLFEKMKDSLLANFDSLYKAKCLSTQSQEEFYVTYTPKEYHYTLYYYDQAGNLVKTLPPAAVKPYYDAAYLADIIAKRAAGTDRANPNNNEVLATQYRYNSLNQVVTQKTPDAGISNFWYDRLGRLVVSQNAKQAAINKYSYTLYDYLGRITQVGQKPQTAPMQQSISQDTTLLKNWLAAGALKEQITRTVYDVSYYSADDLLCNFNVLCQKNLRNRVSYTQLIDNEPPDFATNPNAFAGLQAAATYYSYDIHGNVDTLVQDLQQAMTANLGNRYKKMVYDYDLISGKVNRVSYQHGYADQFYHQYLYDAENRITEVRTSHDSIYWEKEAAYEYYRHGPLSRTELGQNRVQGIDYAYTIQGWLKGVNSTSVLYPQASAGGGYDMGQDGSGPGAAARDAYGFGLSYFNSYDADGNYSGDYKPIFSNANNAFAFINDQLSSWTDGVETGRNVFDGNIRAMLVNVPQLGDGKLYAYRYDQLKRITAMNSYNRFNSASNNFNTSRFIEPLLTEDYKERITYDPNGNIKTYLRNGDAARLAMDDMAYTYKTGTNQLDNAADAAADDLPNYTKYNDIKQGQASGNYQYDGIGNLIIDKSEDIYDPNNPGRPMIEWTVYGKISHIEKIKGAITTNIFYTYDATGNRISKTVTVSGVTTKTIYVRDASGNVMSVYALEAAVNSGALSQTEISMYGSSRLGVYNVNRNVATLAAIDYSNYSGKFIRGNKLFELTNHLGNVLVVVSDKKIGVSSNGTTIDYYTADIITANDYYPFGSQMPGRKYSQPNTKYRYGFNGKENDNEIKGEGNQQDYGMRIYDPRLGRFLSVDPITDKYPELTPYQFASNLPIAAIDLDGLEAKIAIAGKGSPLKKPYGPGGTDYTPSDIHAFEDRANALKKNGFSPSQVHNGKMIVDLFITKTKTDGSILAVVIFAHAGPNGVYLDNDGGFYSSNINKANTLNDANIHDIAELQKSGQIKFEKNAVLVLGACNCGNPNGSPKMSEENLAQNSALQLGITTYGATGSVYPEYTKNKKAETGRLRTDGTFIKYEPYTVTTTVTTTTPHKFLGFTLWKSVDKKTTTETKVKSTDVGNTIDPSKLTH